MPQNLFPEASAFFHLLRNLGTSVFVALSVTLLIRTAKIRYSEMSEAMSPYNESLGFPGVVGEGVVDWTSSLGRLAGEMARQSAMIGYDNAFYFYALTCLMSLPVLSLVTIKKQPG